MARGVDAPVARAEVALFGGSFNPPHVGHVLAVTYALATQPIDRVLVVPVFQHPFAKELAPFEDRLAMCELAMGWLPRTEISAIEQELGGESRTLRTVEELARRHPDWSLRLLVGADVLTEAHKWHRFDRVSELAPPIVLPRARTLDESEPRRVLPDVSSTDVRVALERGRAEDLEAWVPESVLAYIERRGLYRAA